MKFHLNRKSRERIEDFDSMRERTEKKQRPSRGRDGLGPLPGYPVRVPAGETP